MNSKDICCLLLTDCYLPFFAAIGKALEVTPENGTILIFNNNLGYYVNGLQKYPNGPSLWRRHFATSKAKKIKIFWIFDWGQADSECYTQECPPDRCNHGRGYWCTLKVQALHKRLTEGRIYNLASELNINQFFTDAVQ